MINLTIGLPLAPKEEMLSFISFFKVATHLAVDTEGPKDGRTLGVSCAFNPGMGMYFPLEHLEENVNIDDETFEQLTEGIINTKLRVFQNAAHDLEVFEKLGFPLTGPFADTMIMAHMIDENVLSKKLDYLHKYYVGGEGKDRHELMQKYIDNMGWEYVPVQLMNRYATQDAIATSELFETLEPLFIKQFGSLFNDN